MTLQARTANEFILTMTETEVAVLQRPASHRGMLAHQVSKYPELGDSIVFAQHLGGDGYVCGVRHAALPLLADCLPMHQIDEEFLAALRLAVPALPKSGAADDAAA